MSGMGVMMELERLIDRYSDGDGIHVSGMAGLSCLKYSRIGERMPGVFTPSVCFIVQGRKEVLLGDEIYSYTPGEFLAVTVDLPLVGTVTEASMAKPYLTVQIDLDTRLLSELLASGGDYITGGGRAKRGLFVGTADAALQDVVVRLMRLLDTPQDQAVIGPLLMRELHYRLLRSPYGQDILQLVLHGSATQRIAQVITTLKRDFAKALKVEELAEIARMSASSFHHHFKEVTAMSPLQYQKQLRLMEARRLMLAESRTAAHAAYDVGYESSSQFSREYARMFGLPPAADVSRLRLG